MKLKDEMIRALDSPDELEGLYRKDPESFKTIFPELYAELPESPILEFWHARLYHELTAGAEEAPGYISRGFKEILLVIALALIAGTIVRLPLFIDSIDNEFYYSRNLGLIVIITLSVYFIFQNTLSIKKIGILAFIFLVSTLYMNLLPHNESMSDSLILACMHMPFFAWSLLGVVYAGSGWKDYTRRMEFIRYNAEVLIFTTMIIIGGGILSGLTISLFLFTDIHIEEWYMENIAVYGLVASPIVATYIVEKVTKSRLRIAPILAKTFTPLFFATALVYLGTILYEGQSPYSDRDFLITFNVLLIIVLALSVFTISGRNSGQEKSISDILTISLVLITLAIDVIALSAIVIRLSSYGFTPNRIAVLGANLLIFCHLCGVVYYYLRFFFGRGLITTVENWIALYIPVYAIWTVIVAFGFPLFFWGK